MDADSNIAWRARLLPIALGYICGIAATYHLTSLATIVFDHIYLHPPSDVADFLRKVGASVGWWLLTLPIYFLAYTGFAILFAFELALPAAVAIGYIEIHKIRALWPHCLGAVLLCAFARTAFYFCPGILSPTGGGWLSTLLGIGEDLGRLNTSVSMTWESFARLMLITICQGSFAGWIYWLVAVKYAGRVRALISSA